MKRADVVVVGGGIIGLSVAYHLLRRSALRVVVVEREVAPGMGATGRATGGIRHQFSTEANVRLTQLSLPEFQRFELEFGVDVGLDLHGYLFVTADPDRLPALRAAVAMQSALGVPVRVVGPAEIAALVPAIRANDLAGGTFCPLDGSADPGSAVQGYWRRLLDLGGEVWTECEVTDIEVEGGSVEGVETTRGSIAADVVVDAAGAHAAAVGRMAGVDVPVAPYRRTVFVARPLPEVSARVPGGRIPLVVDMDTGWYVHQDRQGNLLLGGTDRVSHPGFSLAVEWDHMQRVLEAAVRRMPCMAGAEVFRAYAGVREITPDFHAILGPVPDVQGFYLACGFSGHGFMHAPAAGILLSEFILDGQARSMDCTPLSLDRFRCGTVRVEEVTF